MAYTYGSVPNVKSYNFVLIFSLLLAATCCLVVGAGARDYDLSLHIYPNPFFAGNPGLPTNVSFSVPNGGTASIYIYDLESNRVRALLEGGRYSPGEHRIEWDGRDDRGDLVAPGPYVVVLELTIQGELYRDTFVAVAIR
jgi:hypothetical protein